MNLIALISYNVSENTVGYYMNLHFKGIIGSAYFAKNKKPGLKPDFSTVSDHRL